MVMGEDADLLQSYADDAEAMREDRTDMEFKLGMVHRDGEGNDWIYAGHRFNSMNEREHVWVRILPHARWPRAVQTYKATDPSTIRRKFRIVQIISDMNFGDGE